MGLTASSSTSPGAEATGKHNTCCPAAAAPISCTSYTMRGSALPPPAERRHATPQHAVPHSFDEVLASRCSDSG